MSQGAAKEAFPVSARRKVSTAGIAPKRRVLMLLATALYPHDVRVHREAMALTAAGCQVSVICPRYTPRARQPWHEVIDGVRVLRYPTPLRRSDLIGYLWGYAYSPLAMFVLSLFVWVRWGFDIIHAHNPPDNLALVAAFYKPLGKLFVFDQHDLAPEMYQAVFPDGGKTLQVLLTKLEGLSYRLADHVICTNESYMAIAIQRGNLAERCVTVVRNGPDLGVMQATVPVSGLCRPGCTTIGYVGAIGLHDGVDYLLRALWHLANDLQRTDFYCVLVGGGRRLARMRRISEELGLADRINFIGWVDHADVAGYLSAFDLCVAPEPSNPYNDRSTVIKIGEYMALGKPTVAFDLPEHRITAQNAAIYAHPNDERDFARKIAMLMDDPDLRSAMGRAGLLRAKSELAWSHQATALISVYASLGKQR